MSKPHSMDDKLFGRRFSILDEMTEHSTGNPVQYLQDRAASEWGRLVAEKKGWTKDRNYQDNGDEYELYFYVLTGAELGAIVDGQIAQEFKRLRPHDGLIDGSGVQSGTDAKPNPERETE